MNGVRVRFAPSPTGSLHLGNARTAIFNWLFARRHTGAFILRIEDTDIEREVEGAEAALLEDLRWIGLDWNEGPDRPDGGGPFGPYRQSERAELYGRQAERLLREDRAYPCFCSPELLEHDRRSQAALGKTPRYEGRCAALPPAESRSRRATGEPSALRLRVRRFPVVRDELRGAVDFTSREPSDPVIVRRDGRPTYNFAVVVDDAAMRISHVLRGDDHLSNTPVQVCLYAALGETPPRFAHLPTVLGPDGSPLSKRHGAVSLGEMRRSGVPAEALARALMLLGWTPPAGPHGPPDLPPSLAEAAGSFELDRVNLSPATFDPPRLHHVSTLVLAALEPADRAVRALPFLDVQGWDAGAKQAAGWGASGLDWLGRLLGLWSGQVSRYPDYAPPLAFVFDFRRCLEAVWDGIRSGLTQAAARGVLAAVREVAAREGGLVTGEAYQRAARAAGEMAGVRGRELFHPLRLALTAAESGPELQRLVPLLDQGAGMPLPAEVLSVAERIDLVLARLSGT